MDRIREQVKKAAEELLAVARCRRRDIIVVGCSSSEIAGKMIGTGSNEDAARAVLEGIAPLLEQRGLFLAAQCCEHLNRALIIEREAAEYYRLPVCNVVPQPKAGGSFATAAYALFKDPVAVERVEAAAGMDVGDTLIGMHLRPVAVPVRVSVKKIGEANLVCARTRPKFLGGVRAQYDENLL